MDVSTDSPSGAPADVMARGAAFALLALLAANMLIDALEVSIMIASMPVIAQDLDYHRVTAVWLISGFACGFAGALMVGGRLAARYGRRRVYLLSLAVFAVASLAGCVVTDPALLTAVRVVKGICAALTAPLGSAIIATTFEKSSDRDRALSVYTLAGGAGFAVGLLAAGAMTQIDWRLTFLVPAVAVAALGVAGCYLVPPDLPSADVDGRTSLGLPSALGFTLGALSLVLALNMVGVHGWRDPRAWTCAAAVLTCAALVARRGHSRDRPLYFSPALRNRTLLSSSACAAAMNGTNLALLSIVTMRMQYDLGWDVLHTAAALLPASVPLIISAPVSGLLIRRFGTTTLAFAGISCSLCAAITFLVHPTPSSYAAEVLPGMLLLGTAFTLGFAALNAQATSTVQQDDKAVAGRLYQTAVQLAAAVVPMIVAACWVSNPKTAPIVVAIVAALGVVAAATNAGTRPSSRHRTSERNPL